MIGLSDFDLFFGEVEVNHKPGASCPGQLSEYGS